MMNLAERVLTAANKTVPIDEEMITAFAVLGVASLASSIADSVKLLRTKKKRLADAEKALINTQQEIAMLKEAIQKAGKEKALKIRLKAQKVAAKRQKKSKSFLLTR